jgi:hypothetical protein
MLSLPPVAGAIPVDYVRQLSSPPRQPSGMTGGDFLRESRDIIRMAAAW